MNTPKKRKRHHVDWTFQEGIAEFTNGRTFHTGLSHPQMSICLAQIATEFEHLEDHLANLLAEVSGVDRTTASYIMRAVLAPRARTALVRDLVQKAPRNTELGDEYDQILDEFDGARKFRNLYVHGRWWTSSDAKIVMFTPTDDHAAWEFVKARLIGVEELNYAVYLIRRTAVLITRVTIIQPERRAQLEAIPPLSPAPTPMSIDLLRSELAKETPQPAPSPASPRKPKGERKLERKARAAKAKKGD